MCLALKARHSPPAWGDALGFVATPTRASAEGATHLPRRFVIIYCFRPENHPRIETRFQRLASRPFEFLERCPRLLWVVSRARMGFVIVSHFIYLFPRASAAASGGVWGSAPSSRSVKPLLQGIFKVG
jgi:hypothetical protein